MDVDIAACASQMWRKTLGYNMLVWVLFFMICCGLGYSTLNRYDPRRTAGTSDAAQYYELVTGGPQVATGHHRYRILVPYMAKPFYWLAKDRVMTWEPVFFGLLIVNSFFCATTAWLLMRVAHSQVGDYATALIGAMLYLLNFSVPNQHLAGYVDSGEACFMMVLAWTLFADKWSLLPLWGVLGALAKETFVPLAGTFTLVWLIVEKRREGFRISRIGWIAAMGIVSLTTVTVLQTVVSGRTVWPWYIVTSEKGSDYLGGFLRCILDRNFWYVFIWLLPLGVWRLRCLPQPWVLASIITAFVALLLGAYHDSLGNVARPMFSVAGPVLSLSVAVLLRASAISNSRFDQVPITVEAAKPKPTL